jgi:hypothetical protein
VCLSNCAKEGTEALFTNGNFERPSFCAWPIKKLNMRGSSIVFDVAKARLFASTPVYCQAQVVRDWANQIPCAVPWYFDLSLRRVREGDLASSVLLASMTQDQTLIHSCAEAVRNDEQVLLFFFSSTVCCCPTVGLPELKAYVGTRTNSQNLLGRLLPSAAVETIHDRQWFGRHGLLSVARLIPFAPHQGYIIRKAD